MSVWAAILAAGSGNRLKEALENSDLAATGLAGREGKPPRKQYIQIDGSPMFWRSVKPFAATAALRGLIFAFPPEDLDWGRALVAELYRRDDPGLDYLCVPGGELRQESVRSVLAALPRDCDRVLVHDAARPFVTPALIARVLEGLRDHAAVIPAIPVIDTIKEVGVSGFVERTPERAALRAVQTPQGFRVRELKEAHAMAQSFGWVVTDDAALLERCSIPVFMVAGDEHNRKITTEADLALLYPHYSQFGPFSQAAGQQWLPCTGFGYDVHRYGGKRPFILGGVEIPTSLTIEAHSDGDVLTHALMDAILGVMGAGDIGVLFPDSDPALDNADSLLLLSEVLEKFRRQGLRLTHVDLTVVAQEPRVNPFRVEIVKKLAKLLQLDESSVNLKATTEEHLGFTGEKKGVKAFAVVSGLRPKKKSFIRASDKLEMP